MRRPNPEALKGNPAYDPEAALALHSAGGGRPVLPLIPTRLADRIRWVRDRHQDWVMGVIDQGMLQECRRSALAMGDLDRIMSEERKAVAMESLADTMAAVEHGGAALLMMSRLQESLSEGKRKAIPAKVRPAEVSAG